MIVDRSMSDELRIRQLLEEILDSERTPEEVWPRRPTFSQMSAAQWERLRHHRRSA